MFWCRISGSQRIASFFFPGTDTRKAAIEEAFAQLKKQIKPQDNFVLILIGHGSFDTDYKLNIMGADLTGKEYSALIDSLNAGANDHHQQHGFQRRNVRNPGGKNRVLIAASRSGEKEDTVFYEHFLAGLKGVAADEDKDKKVSVWEAFKYATAGVERFYKEQTRLLTEHAGLSAGRSPSSRSYRGGSGRAGSGACYVFECRSCRHGCRSEASGLLNERKAIEQKIETLRLDKNLLPEAEYEKRLEELILELARKNQEIQEQQKK